MSESKKKTVLYIGYRTDLLPKGKVKKSGDEAPIIKMIKNAHPSIIFDDILVEAHYFNSENTAFQKLISECESENIETVVVPSLGTLGSSPIDVFTFIRKLQKADPSVKVFFALEEMIHPSDEFDFKAQLHYMVKDEYALARKRKREFMNV